MRRFSGRPRRRVLAVLAGSTAVLMAGSLAGSATARPNPDKLRPFEYARSYTVAALPSDQWTEVQWADVGQARLRSLCTAGYDAQTGAWGVGMKALTVENTGPHPVAVTWPSDPIGPGPSTTRMLAPGEREAFFIVGQVTNSDQSPAPGGGATTFAILSEDGPSVTGTIAWLGRWEPSDKTGRCTFSLQMKG